MIFGMTIFKSLELAISQWVRYNMPSLLVDQAMRHGADPSIYAITGISVMVSLQADHMFKEDVVPPEPGT